MSRVLTSPPIALTLFRGTRRTTFTEGEVGGQLRRGLSFTYRIVPLDGGPDRTRLCEMGQELSAGLRNVQLRPADVGLYRGGVSLPPTAGFVRVEGAAVTTSIRRAGDGLEIRVFNPTCETIAAVIDTTGRPPGTGPYKTIQRVNLESTALAEPKPLRAKEEITLKPKEIATLRLDH